ncbi:MAG TPA: acyl-CoA dehydrogenase [Steroidobacteraceae bacterium]|nr:acyl-CoA dehydrogenase [Steroidobacteraceae bacterium]
MYRAPLKDIQFALDEVVGAQALAGCPELAEYSSELAASVLEEAARLAESVLDPLYRSADEEGAHWSAAGVRTAAGFKEAYRQYCDGGWTQLRASPEYGGQGMPRLLVSAVEEIFASANLAFRMCPMLTGGAIEAISAVGSPAQRDLYLPRMVRGEWTGTMNLTEPQAGSDLAQVRTRAVAQGDHFLIQGQKIFITYGEHDFTENIVHLVLARIEGAPPGTRGISLFIVPKFLVNPDGSLGARNDVQCVSIEHKLGIRASPTCTMIYGQGAGAVGYLLGEPNHGLEYMFIMMNAARLSVGLEGYSVAERSYQQALEWARTRVQGRPRLGKPIDAAQPLAIQYHPDVHRMLLTMKSHIEAMRHLALYTAAELDVGHGHPDPARRASAQARGELLIPIVKGWCTESGFELASLGIQVHGGMGFIEETGAAQPLRDARIGAIYEGTTGIQAGDLVGRKLARDGGQAFRALATDIHLELAGLRGAQPPVAQSARAADEALRTLEAVIEELLGPMGADAGVAAAVAVPLLKMAGLTLGAWLHARAAHRAQARLAEGAADAIFLKGKLETARFYVENLLPQALALNAIVRSGAGSIIESDPTHLT